ncbi:MAG TPA: PepSY domain-containing protein, partial [Vicinamibacteria bacterium]
MTLRKAVFWCHLSAGTIAGLVVLVMSVTGVLLSFERQIVAWADGMRVTPPADGAPRLRPQALLERARAARPEARVSTLTLRREPEAPA